MNTDIELALREAAEAIRSLCHDRYQTYSDYGCIDTRNWTYEQECRFGSNEDYELSLKLDSIADKICDLQTNESSK
jgi:hypothetical protein